DQLFRKFSMSINQGFNITTDNNNNNNNNNNNKLYPTLGCCEGLKAGENQQNQQERTRAHD
ncbi:MAG: hypothetical protein ACRCVL_01095, partial [Cetobacterium sp.]